MKIYLAGYTGRKPDQLKKVAEHLNLTVVDIRLSPRSRVSYWSKQSLQLLLGNRYVWIKELGNLNYKGGPIQISDIGNGTDRAVGICSLFKTDMLLLCACEHGFSCHRSVVGAEFARQGFQVEEIDWSKALADKQLNTQGVLL